ncbi:hypothetical protein HORIV_65410 [Vreelandella olivaria]|uniref:Pentapeptide repeat-containing protein n=1 Tax=Vreelandella olivaria TaxID=390919 RepID=A0ABM7GTV2_9GAMM|nr:hypothetical protein HORIV_65410 [Halomonas olivaria]
MITRNTLPLWRRQTAAVFLCLSAIGSVVADDYVEAYQPPVHNGCELVPGAQCVNMDLSGGDFANLDLQGANFAGSNLDGSDFRHSNLRSVDFEGASLRNANLNRARMPNTTCVVPIFPMPVWLGWIAGVFMPRERRLITLT